MRVLLIVIVIVIVGLIVIVYQCDEVQGTLLLPEKGVSHGS